MERDLPKMYRSKFDKEINNNRSVFSSLIDKKGVRSDNREVVNDKKYDRFTIEQKIFNIFNAKDYIYKADVKIVTDEQVLTKRIIGKNSNNLITMDNEYIPISVIRDIYKS